MSCSYEPKCFPQLAAIERKHFWFRVRNRVISVLAGQVERGLGNDYLALEVGCGTGNTLRAFEAACVHGRVIGLDVFMESLHYSQKRVDSPLVQADARNLPLKPGFSLVGLFDVLEHLDDDAATLSNLNDLLIHGGALLLTVPAHKSLWSYSDRAAGHHRRYEAEELHSKLIAAGFQIEYLTEYMSVLFPIMWFIRRICKSRHPGRRDATRADFELLVRDMRIVPVANRILYWLHRRDIAAVERRRKLSIGTSLVAVARKA